jgi:hypothetical protein
MAVYKPIWGKTQEYSNKKSRQLLALEYTDVKASLIEQVEHMIANG